MPDFFGNALSTLYCHGRASVRLETPKNTATFGMVIKRWCELSDGSLIAVRLSCETMVFGVENVTSFVAGWLFTGTTISLLHSVMRSG